MIGTCPLRNCVRIFEVILTRARRKSESILSYGEIFQRSDGQNLPKRRAEFPMWTGSEGISCNKYMNNKALFTMSYGVYVTTSVEVEKPVGCITNSNTQITALPATISVSVNHDNYTTKCIEKSGLFGYTVLSVKSDPHIIGKFGFFSSDNTDKFADFKYKMQCGVPVLTDGCAYAVCRVTDKIETATHSIFLGEIIDADMLDPNEPMTYEYYHKVLKGKSPSKAPTYFKE